MIKEPQFRIALAPRVKTFQTLQIGLGASTLALFIVVILLYATGHRAAPTPEQVALIRTLTLVHLVMAVIQFFAVPMIVRRMSSPPVIEASSPHDLGRAYVGALQATRLIQLALFESLAVLGLVICLLAATNGVLQTIPAYWINLLSSLTFLGYVLLTFPTEERLVNQFHDRFGR